MYIMLRHLEKEKLCLKVIIKEKHKQLRYPKLC